MTVSRKRKRPIAVDGRAFLWWVAEDEERFGSDQLVDHTFVTPVNDRKVFVAGFNSTTRSEIDRVFWLTVLFRVD